MTESPFGIQYESDRTLKSNPLNLIFLPQIRIWGFSGLIFLVDDRKLLNGLLSINLGFFGSPYSNGGSERNIGA